MEVIFAYYGLTCSSGHITLNNQYKSTEWVAGLCDGRNYCTGVVSQIRAKDILGDPYVGCCKDFLAVAVCPSGQVIANQVECEASHSGRSFYLACN